MTDQLYARKLMGYSDVRTDLLPDHKMPASLQEVIQLQVDLLGQWCRQNVVDDMPTNQESGTLIVEYRIVVGKLVPTSDAVLDDLDRVMRNAHVKGSTKQ